MAEFEALNKFDLFAACVVEGHFQAVAEAKFYGLQVNRESIIESVAMLATHLRNLQWFFLRDRQAAADVTFSLLQKAHWVFSKNNKNTSGIAVPEAKL